MGELIPFKKLPPRAPGPKKDKPELSSPAPPEAEFSAPKKEKAAVLSSGELVELRDFLKEADELEKEFAKFETRFILEGKVEGTMKDINALSQWVNNLKMEVSVWKTQFEKERNWLIRETENAKYRDDPAGQGRLERKIMDKGQALQKLGDIERKLDRRERRLLEIMSG